MLMFVKQELFEDILNYNNLKNNSNSPAGLSQNAAMILSKQKPGHLGNGGYEISMNNFNNN